MIIGKVVGSLFSTRKSEKLVGNKFMIVEYVMVAQGSAARIGCDMEDAPVDAAIVGIIDEGQDWSR